MSSIIEGYNYDIFISYRQKDNKGDRWVSEFVEALKTELESTFKEEISVYFDINPHDGLLETHDVNASLKEKLKCLIFIPIISRTYCDPKSFAWEHEFKVFVEQASNDQFGLKIKLPNGNVANRVLPVRIHDLDVSDIKECESVLGGVLRGVEFVYKESGIDKPLSIDDDEKKNLNNTKYRIQIIKVAHAIREIMLGIKTDPMITAKEKYQPKESRINNDQILEVETPTKILKTSRLKKISGFVIAAILILAAILFYPKIFHKKTLESLRSSDGRISVAVMPFTNLTNDTLWDVWQDGIQVNLITSLSNSEELKVKQKDIVTRLLQNKGLTNYGSITPSIGSEISQRLGADIFVSGSINKAGYTIRLNAQLVNSETEVAFKSFQFDGTSERILSIIDSLSTEIRNYLIISVLKKQSVSLVFNNLSTNSPEAYKDYIYGWKAFCDRDYSTARKFFFQALAIDSNFIDVIINMPFAFDNQGYKKEGRDWALKVYEKRNNMTMIQKIKADFIHAAWFETPYEEIKYLKQLGEAVDDQYKTYYWQLGLAYQKLNQYDKAIPFYEKQLDVYHKLNLKPDWIYSYITLEWAYHKTGQHQKEIKLFKMAEHDFQDDPELIYTHATLFLSDGDTVAANKYIKKYITIKKEDASSEADIKSDLAGIYSEAGVLDRAETYFREAISLDNEDWRRNQLAYFLINNNLNVDEGLNLIDPLLKSSPDNYVFMDTKGWGLYKQGKYKEAYEILLKSWDLRRKNDFYDHEAYLHLEAAKKAVANQKNN
jgi:TolB-like protein/tetratricopeptide (TPR) repeat protein